MHAFKEITQIFINILMYKYIHIGISSFMYIIFLHI